MTESEIKSMLNDIINNDGNWQYRKPGYAVVSVSGVPTTIKSPSNWIDYKLGEEIHPDWEYKKIVKWYVIEFEDKHFEIKNTKKYMDVVFEGSEDECKRWIEKHTKKTWYEEYLYQCTCYEGERIAAETAIEDVCKKILEELGEELDKDNYLLVKTVIENLGVEI